MDNYRSSYSAQKIMRRKLMARIIIVSLSILTVIALLLYICMSVGVGRGYFEVSALKPTDKVFTMSETADFAEPTVLIRAKTLRDMDNISGIRHIPDNVDNIDGSHNGENYFAHTFYLRNVSEASIDVRYKLSILRAYKGAEKAMRVRIYRNGEPLTYAMANDNGEAEFGTLPFMGTDAVTEDVLQGLLPQETVKFTIVIWVEGDDPDCVDSIRGGAVSFAMDFTTEI